MKPERASSTASRRQDVANKHQRNDENLGFSSFRPRKGRQDVGTFREVSRSWLPCPLAGRSRRPSRPPFTARLRRFAIQASLASVARSRARAAPRSSAVFPQLTPDPLQLTTLPTGDRMLALSMKPERASSTASRRQDVANKHQRNDENLGFSSFRPRKGRQDVGAFREVRPGPDAARCCVCCGSRSRCPR